MSEAYSIARTEMVQEQEQPPQARQEEDVPILFLHDVERQYRQGDETVHVLNGIELALLAGAIGCTGCAVGRRQVDASACRRAA